MQAPAEDGWNYKESVADSNDGIDRAAELLAEFDFAYGMYDVDVSVDYFIDDEHIDLPYRLEVAREGWPLLWEDESPWDHDQRRARDNRVCSEPRGCQTDKRRERSPRP